MKTFCIFKNVLPSTHLKCCKVRYSGIIKIFKICVRAFNCSSGCTLFESLTLHLNIFLIELISFSYSITNDVNSFHSKLGFAIPPFFPKLQCVLQTNSSHISIYEWIKLLLSELFDNRYNKRWHLQSYSAINIKRSARHIFH